MTLSPTYNIERLREALLRLVEMLVGVPGLEQGGAMALSKSLRGTVLFYLRPMEAATVRLIAVMASVLKQGGYGPKLLKVSPKLSKPIPKGGSGDRAAHFSLFDPRQSSGMGMPPPRYAKHDPCILFFDGADPPREQQPDISRPRTDGLIDARRLRRRLEALHGALGDLEKQAKRLLRAQAKRVATSKPPRSPIRRGRPPGHRARCQWEVDEILRDCHALALWTLSPDTS